jgi:hypothetical protein
MLKEARDDNRENDAEHMRPVSPLLQASKHLLTISLETVIVYSTPVWNNSQSKFVVLYSVLHICKLHHFSPLAILNLFLYSG